MSLSADPKDTRMGEHRCFPPSKATVKMITNLHFRYARPKKIGESLNDGVLSINLQSGRGYVTFTVFEVESDGCKPIRWSPMVNIRVPFYIFYTSYIKI